MTIWIALAYLLAAVLFILGLKQLSSPRGARRGNQTAAVGMVIALLATLPSLRFTTAGIVVIILGLAIGAPIGAVSARQVHMTAMPQMVAAFYAGQQVVNALLAIAIVALAVANLAIGSQAVFFIPLLLLALVLGVAFVIPIGGADMPVVISLLNAFTGLSVAASGFVLNNFALIVAGTLVGASGTLLTTLMSQAMGRSLANVLFGAFGQVQTAAGGTAVTAEGKSVRSGSPEDVGTMLAYARKVIIVPGYGLAVAQGQHAVKELADELEKRGVEVDYAIHPVAGRMPGHMNVLLAEANVPYEQLKEMDDINGEFQSADVAMVVGANDVVNPAARNTPGSPIYGMPILNVDQAKNIVFMKRSMRPGFAGIDNELLYDPKTIMLFGDAKDSLTKLVGAVKAA
ncbi:MAG: NAD(P)(+) transhydrogenase (Re/Si-specific) subunit beta [Chloroflexi bacterium]|nr:MAG: NAD(P)(+) transhydrogenase (Re/Si-specific) subunit beta [Chloroflexota bacterium]